MIKKIKNILVISYRYPPDIGGIETVSQLLVSELILLGYQVTVITSTTTDNDYDVNADVVRNPDIASLFYLCSHADLVLHSNISVNLGWPAWLLLKPQVIVHHTWIRRIDGRIGLIDRVKRALLHLGYNVAVSKAIAADLLVPSVVVNNPYDVKQFRELDGVTRERDLIFLGRLVSDKGVDLLLQALSILGEVGLQPKTTIVGGGPEEENLKQMARDLRLDHRVDFVGVRQGEDLVAILNAHRILVVPSRWREPYGVVALEGIACGCVVVGSEEGGLKDAIGPCGLTFPNGDAKGLARCLERLLRDPAALSTYRAAAHQHLQVHHPRSVVQKYLQVMEAAYLRRPLPPGSSSESKYN